MNMLTGIMSTMNWVGNSASGFFLQQEKVCISNSIYNEEVKSNEKR